MNILNETVSFNANGISYNIPRMRKVIEDDSTYNNLNIEEVVPQIELKEKINDKEKSNRILEEIKNRLPIAVFKGDNVSIILNNNENQLIVASVNNEKDSIVVSTIFENLLKANIANFSQLNSVTLTYTRNVNAQDEKLKLLNEKVECINGWEKNKTFILTIPFDYDEYMLSIKIQKLINKNKDDKNRLYQFSSFFNFSLETSVQKQETLKNILQNYSNHVYSKLFIEKYSEFMGLKYDK